MVKSINLKFPLKRSPKGAFEVNNTTIAAVTDDLRILLLTNYGERPIHYDFGANLRRVLFEQEGADVRQRVADSIVSAVERWMPFVFLEEITVDDSTTKPTLRPNEVRVTIKFSVAGVQGILSQEIRA